MKIYLAELDVRVELHAGSAEEAAAQRERLVEVFNRVLSASPALHALGVIHFHVDLLDTFQEKPQSGSPGLEMRRSDAEMTPTHPPLPADRHARALGTDDSMPDDTPPHYTDASATSASGAGGTGGGDAGL